MEYQHRHNIMYAVLYIPPAFLFYFLKAFLTIFKAYEISVVRFDTKVVKKWCKKTGGCI